MNPAPATSRLTGALVALGLSLPLLADVPGAFTGGDVLRPVALGAVLAVALVLAGLQLTGPLPSRGRLLLAALPLLVACLAIPAAAGEGLLPLARRLTPWLALSLLPLVMVRALVDDRRFGIATNIPHTSTCLHQLSLAMRRRKYTDRNVVQRMVDRWLDKIARNGVGSMKRVELYLLDKLAQRLR